MRVAIVYDHLVKVGGAEQVLCAFSEIYPDAIWYTSFYDQSKTPFTTTWNIHSFPFLHSHHEWFPWLMSFIFEAFDFGSYDLVISVGSGSAKGVITKPGTIHLHYCLTPTRYLYSHKDEYLNNKLYRFVADILRKWDLVASTRPDEMIAISTQVKKRIKKYYNREADIIFPPVDIHRFSVTVSPCHRDTDYYLVVSRLVPYKKIDVLINAANLTKKNLIVIGTGTESKRLKRIAGPTVELLGYVADEDLLAYYKGAKAYLQANEEDFGISMCEALSTGVPVIAYAKGGALDIIDPGKNGILLKENTVSSFAKALNEFDTMSFPSYDCVASVARFDKDIWKKKIKERIEKLCQIKNKM